jgi:glycosyltransferase involved in cell wall biosynthesis
MVEKISIVIPVYNEETAVKETIISIKNIIKNIPNYEFEIIAVDDCSKDCSGSILDKTEGIKTIHNISNKGYGASLKKGIKASSGEWILITDADGTYPVKDIPRLLKYTQDYDMVVGARKGKNVSIPFMRRPAKLFLNKFASYLAQTKIPDLNSGLRIFKKEIALTFWNLFPEKFSFTSTITMACLTNGYDVKYINIDYYKRKGKSTIHPIKDFIGFSNLLLKLIIYFKPLRFFMPISTLMMAVGMIILINNFIVRRDVTDSSILIILSGMQIWFIGIVAELIAKKR